jgi:tRNA 2-selenouridine synthase
VRRDRHSVRKNTFLQQIVVKRQNGLHLQRMNRVNARAFLQLGRQGLPLLDARAPSEYHQGCLPGAVSLPLFEDAERAAIGTAYKQQCPTVAFDLGLEIVGPKLAGFVRTARKLAPGREVGIYCARGGQRSGAMGWLLSQAGFEVHILEGGYKALRQHYLDVLAHPQVTFHRIGGKTGSRKTAILRILQEQGQPVIDLEHLAAHRGSAFGKHRDREQPTNEAFENILAMALLRFPPSTAVWVEDESRHIGRNLIPEGVWQLIRQSPLYFIERSFPERLAHILEGYEGLPAAYLIAAFQKIRMRMGPQHADAAIQYVEKGDIATAASLALRYYDKLYEYQKNNQPAHLVHLIEAQALSDDQVAQLLNQKAKSTPHE